MSLHGPIRAPGDLPARSLLVSPTRCPGSRGRAGAPAPEPAEKFRRCKREKTQLRRTPAPTLPAAPPRSPTPGGRDLGHPGRSRGPEEGLPCGLAGGHRRRPGAAATSPRPARGRLPRPARPSAPRRSRARAGAPLTPPRRAGARAGCVGYIGLGSASGAPRAVALGGCLSPPNSRGLSRLSLLSPLPSPPPLPSSLLLSCPSALFSGLITFRIKAKPSPGCEYNAPPSPPGAERGAGAPRAGRGRGQARGLRGPGGGGAPGGGPRGCAPGPPRPGGRPCRGRPCFRSRPRAAGVRVGKGPGDEGILETGRRAGPRAHSLPRCFFPKHPPLPPARSSDFSRAFPGPGAFSHRGLGLASKEASQIVPGCHACAPGAQGGRKF